MNTRHQSLTQRTHWLQPITGEINRFRHFLLEVHIHFFYRATLIPIPVIKLIHRIKSTDPTLMSNFYRYRKLCRVRGFKTNRATPSRPPSILPPHLSFVLFLVEWKQSCIRRRAFSGFWHWVTLALFTITIDRDDNS